MSDGTPQHDEQAPVDESGVQPQMKQRKRGSHKKGEHLIVIKSSLTIDLRFDKPVAKFYMHVVVTVRTG